MPDAHTAAPAATPAYPRPTPDPLDIPPGFDRHRDALAIVDTGACNPAGITRTLTHAFRQIIAEHGDQRTDPAARLIVHQLAFLMNDYSIGHDPDEYARLRAACQEKAGTAG